MNKSYPYYLANKPASPNRDLVVTNKFTGRVACKVAVANKAAVDRAIGAAARASTPMRRMKSYERRAVLDLCVRRLSDRAEELARVVCVEAGKPIRDARAEVGRMVETFRIAAEESVRVSGEYLPLDISARAAAHRGVLKRVPVGPCSLITPFNFPLNLVAHKVAPAIAAGCPFVLKPSLLTPVSAMLIGQVLSETGLPPGAFSILPCDHEDAAALVEDERIKLLSFTGSDAVGWDLKRRAGRKKVVLELGGNASCIVEPDADLDDAVARNIVGAFYQSGQSCISVQRLWIHEKVYAAFKKKFLSAAKKLRAGAPEREETFIGPIISLDHARRIEQWVGEAVAAGARRLLGGRRRGRMMPATVLEGVPEKCKVSCLEVFGPVVVLEKYREFGDAIRRINAGEYGLQTGVFTRDLHRAMHAWDELEVGGVMINEVPSWRVDAMPYGGVKGSGLGREGVRWAIEEMTEPRLLVIRDKSYSAAP